MSTGIRVNSESLRAQLAHRGMSEQAELPFMKAVLEDRLPFCFGGGIGVGGSWFGEIPVRLPHLVLSTTRVARPNN